MTERQQAEELRGTQLLGEEEMAIYEDFKRIAAIQKRLDGAPAGGGAARDAAPGRGRD